MAERSRSRSFAPTVALGLAGAGLAALAASRTWSTASAAPDVPVPEVVLAGHEAAPLALALGLVLLAAWGALLVVRRRARLALSALGLVSAGTVVGTVVSVLGRLDELAAERLAVDAAVTGVTAWPAVTGVAALLAGGCFAVALLRCGQWPEMDTRYDAPGARGRRPATQQDMWRALDEGHDPTA